MNLFEDRRVVLGLGGVFAVIAALGMAIGIKARDRGDNQPPPASRGGLVVDARNTDDGVDPGKPLRCFVDGQFVGMATLTDCAKRNGVATNALDVGIDPTGALAAANNAGQMITPLPPVAAPSKPPVTLPSAPAVPVATCWRHTGQWVQLPGNVSLNACVQTLFAGRCERPGSASYGRWADQTLRLVPGRVEVSSDNRNFRPLVEQAPGNCSLPAVSG